MADAPKQPTSDQCNANTRVYETEAQVGYAVWYPQMGGYVGKAIAVMDKRWSQGCGGCIDVYVWHNGEFPFGDGETPVLIHHCSAEQFIEFGHTLSKLNELGRS